MSDLDLVHRREQLAELVGIVAVGVVGLIPAAALVLAMVTPW